jgi:predicted O-methyltransferase YrrM
MLFKNKNIKLIDIFFIFISFVFLLIIGLFLKKTLSFKELLFLILCFILIIFVILQIYRRLSKHFEYLINLKSKEIEDKLNLELDKLSGELLVYSFHLNIPPIFTKWTIDGDLLKIIIDEIYSINKNNITILELGSGLSTIFLSYILKKLNKGKLYSIEHDELFYKKTKNLLELNDLNDICNLIYSPLEEIYINGKKWIWYNTKFINNIDNLDILIIDGPPGYIQEMSRFPALPMLINKLNNNSIVFFDDASREDEKNIIEKWRILYPNFSFKIINTSKGAIKIIIL